MTPTKLGCTIAIAVASGILAAQAIPVIVSEVYYAANPCDRPGLSGGDRFVCESTKRLARTRQVLDELEKDFAAKKAAREANKK